MAARGSLTPLAGSWALIGVCEVSPGYEDHKTGFEASLPCGMKIMVQYSITPA